MKMYKYIELLTYYFFRRYLLRQLYHICPNYLNSYKNRCSLIKYMLRGFVSFTSGNLNPLGIFMCISLSIDSHKYTITTSMRCISNPFETLKPIKNQNVIVLMTREYVSYSQYQVFGRNLIPLIVFYIILFHFLIAFFVLKKLFIPNKLFVFKRLDY